MNWIVKEKNTERKPQVQTGEFANRIEISFDSCPEDKSTIWTYGETSKNTDQIKEVKTGTVRKNREALIAKARQNAQERKCQFLVNEGFRTLVNESYRE